MYRILLIDKKMRNIGIIPQEILESNNLNELIQQSFIYAWTDSNSKCALEWNIAKKDSDDKWPDIQYDFETGNGAAAPRDVIFGFEFLPSTPCFPKNRRKEGIEFMSKKLYNESMVPPLESLRKLTRKDYCMNCPWILLCRFPRPRAARHVIPMNRRPDVDKLKAAIYTNTDNGKGDELILQIKAKYDLELHPTESEPWHITNQQTLLCPPNSTFVCQRCCAVGHHYTLVHDEVMEHYSSSVNKVIKTDIPAWLGVIPLPVESLQYAQIDDDTLGFELKVRNTTANVPLRLARHLKLKGANIQGSVPVCGVD